jgi:iron complex outermembrane receptor protein
MKRGLFRGASAVTVVFCANLLAHSAQAQARAAAPAAASPEGSVVGEVVVTAEKRSQLLERVPVAITAFTSKQRDLQGIQSIQDLTDYTPGLSYTAFDNRPYMRGIGRNTDNLAVESGVAIYVDGVYNGANASTILQSDTLFIDQIQVLRGPQSTLYGRNADGGAIDYISKRPTHDFEAEGRAGYDNYDKYFGEAVVSGPITDWLRFRIGGNYTQQTGGFYKNRDGAPEGGDVAQGGSGVSYHVEAQVEGSWGDKLDSWTKVAASDYDVTFHTETLLGPQDTREFPNPLFPNPNFGLCTLPNAGVNPGCTDAGNADTVTSVQTLKNTTALNPSSTTLRSFDSGFKSRSKEARDIIIAQSLTYHADDFDVKYLFGYQNFDYSLNAPWVNSQGVSSGVVGLTLKGPAAPTPLCLVNFGNAGCGQDLQVNSLHNNFTFIEKEYFWSNELNITSKGDGPVTWVAGLYQYHEHYDQPINVKTPDQAQVASPYLLGASIGNILSGNPLLVKAAANPTRSEYNEDTLLNEESLGVFGQVDWQMSDEIKLTGGVRYSYDHKYGEEQFRVMLFDVDGLIPGFPLGALQFGNNAPAFDVTACPAGEPFLGAGHCAINPKTGKAFRSLNADWDAFTGNAVLTWTPSRDTLVYGKYSRGYKTGGFNSGTMLPTPETEPELVNAFEVGVKKTIGATIQVNASAFYYQYYNDQQPLGQLGSNGVINTIIINIPESRSVGLELEGIWSPIKDLQLSGNYAFLDAEIANMQGQCFQDSADPGAFDKGANQGRGCNTGANAGKGLQDLTNQTLPEAPKHKISLNALYTMHFDPGSLSLSGTYVWKDRTYDSVFNRSYNLSPAYTQVNFRATWTGNDNRYSVIFYVNNLFDSIGYDGTGGLQVTGPSASQTIDRLVSLTAPRVYGVELQYRFR